MPHQYVLDTNAYALFFQRDKGDAYNRLIDKVRNGNEVIFCLPEIVAMEIHSVIGKYRRGGAKPQHERCSRKILAEPQPIQCENTCVSVSRARIKGKTYKALQKLLCDIENQRGDIKAELLALGKAELDEGRRILIQYSHQYSFGSHDALVAGTVAVARSKGGSFILVTSDKGLKAVCRDQGIEVFDPLHVA